MAIGIFDSGVGGLTVYRTVAENFKELDMYYLGDTARVPYGSRSKDNIQQYSLECAKYLIDNFNIEALIVACNTASSFAVELLEETFKIPVLGVVNPGALQAVRVSKNKNIGVIGTRATVRSESYVKAINSISEDEIHVIQKPCPLFVPFVEELMLDHPATRMVAGEYLNQMVDSGIDTLILGCTHYPLLKPLMKGMFPDINIVDSSEVIVEHLKNMDIKKNEKGIRRIFVTDESPAFEKLKNILSEDIPVKRIRLEPYCG